MFRIIDVTYCEDVKQTRDRHHNQKQTTNTTFLSGKQVEIPTKARFI